MKASCGQNPKLPSDICAAIFKRNLFIRVWFNPQQITVLIFNCAYFVPLDMKGSICHIVKWQMHPFISKGTISPPTIHICMYNKPLPSNHEYSFFYSVLSANKVISLGTKCVSKHQDMKMVDLILITSSGEKKIIL